MQAKGLVKFFSIALLVVCLYQLSFTYVASREEGKAVAYAKEVSANIEDKALQAETERKAKTAYEDSISNEVVYNFLFAVPYTYKECKARQLNLGLDLQGGMSVVLEVSMEDLIKIMANKSKDPTFNQALANAKARQKNTQADFVTLFGEEFSKIDPQASLAAIFALSQNAGDITFKMSNEEVLEILRVEADKSGKRVFDIIRARIDRFGVSQPNINLLEGTNRIMVELPGVDNPERVRELLVSTAQLEFWEVAEMSNSVMTMLNSANEIVKKKVGVKEAADTEPADTASDNDATADSDSADDTSDGDATADSADDTSDDTATADADTSGVEESTSLNTDPESSLEDGGSELDSLTLLANNRKNNPFTGLLQIYGGGSRFVGVISHRDTADFNSYLKMPEVEAVFTAQKTKLLYGIADKGLSPSGDIELIPVFAIESRLKDFKPPLDGSVITSAGFNFGQNPGSQEIAVSMNMNKEGAKAWDKLTAANVNQSIAIVLDDVVYSAPNVIQRISGGSSTITGDFTIQEAEDLANKLESGKFPARVVIIEEAIVGASLGEASIKAGLLSLLAGLALVMTFMVLYYNMGGVVSVIALLLNLFFLVGVLASLGSTLTLPGMAGIVLTIGMAVDANVIIYERIREELMRGSGKRKAIADGFSKSYSAIIDANLTTLITAIILAWFGLGPVLGFAVVLIIGIFSSMFTAVLVNRLIIDWLLANEKPVAFANKWSNNAFKNLNYNFINKRKISYVVSTVVIVLGIASIVFRGFDLGIDFQGGRTYTIEFDKAVNTEEVSANLSAVLEGDVPLVRTFGADNQVKITTAYMIDSEDEKANDIVETKLYEGLSGMYDTAPTKAVFLKDYKKSSQKVGPTIADDISYNAILATLFALLGIFLYILIRFRKWQFGAAAVVTIIHDTLIILSIFSIFAGILPFSMEINQVFIAALLTVIGYSINDTVVVFDRIREYLQLYTKKAQKEVINDAINSTLSRTIITSFTTLMVVLILFIFGGFVIRGFAFALLIGVIIGTYSSIFIATPLVVDLSAASEKSKAKKAKAAPASKKKLKVQGA